MLRMFFRSTFIFLLSVFVLLLFLADGINAKLNRLNGLSVFQEYPLGFALGKEPYRKQAFYSAIAYYQTYVRIANESRFLLKYKLPRVGFNKPSSVLMEAMASSGRPEEILAFCYFYTEEDQLAEKILKDLVKRFPDRCWIKYNLALIKFKRGLFLESFNLLKSIQLANPTDQWRGAVLASLETIKDQKNQLLMLLPGFVQDIRSKSLALMVLLEEESDHYRNNKSVHVSWEQMKELGFVPILHPWSFYILPGKEFFYN